MEQVILQSLQIILPKVRQNIKKNLVRCGDRDHRRSNEVQVLEPSYVPDIYRGCGPLGGIHSAFVHSRAQAVFVAACDTPFLAKDLIYHIINTDPQSSVRIPACQGKMHPLCGFYSRVCLPEIQHRLEQRQLKVLDLLKQVNARTIEITPDLEFYRRDLLLNLNEPKDFISALS